MEPFATRYGAFCAVPYASPVDHKTITGVDAKELACHEDLVQVNERRKRGKAGGGKAHCTAQTVL